MSWDKINCKLDTAEKKTELEDIAITIIWNKVPWVGGKSEKERGKKKERKQRASVTCETVSGGLTYV